ncbi:exodeoxyribonuclease VII small subunit [bacterium]|nr:exodeoxyribonuclease VII small subunit [bacterium]MBU1985223.1 exodeoxyribonuclease VII small subunit [bacterium]
MTEKTKRKEEPVGEPGSFEDAIERLETLVAGLESGEVPLEKSVKAFEEGQRLIAYCEKTLKAAEQALKQIAADADKALGNRDEPK